MSTDFCNISWDEDDNLFINNRYQLLDRIGHGNFGDLRKARDITNDKMVAVKLEKINYSAGNTLRMEYHLYKKIKDEPGFPRVYYFGTHGRYNVLVMDLLGPTLDDQFNLCEHKFNIITICRLAVQVIARLESLHRHGIIFRDVKPDNFLFGLPQSETEDVLYLIDLGLSKEYIDPQTGIHIPYREGINLTGTARYMSINVHLGREQSRRDDLEAAGYMLVYLIRGSLPWQGLKGPNLKAKFKLILNKKMTIPIKEICTNCPEEVFQYLSYVRKLKFEEEPDYKWLKELFIALLKKSGGDEATPYCWKTSPEYKRNLESRPMNAEPVSSVSLKVTKREGVLSTAQPSVKPTVSDIKRARGSIHSSGGSGSAVKSFGSDLESSAGGLSSFQPIRHRSKTKPSSKKRLKLDAPPEVVAKDETSEDQIKSMETAPFSDNNN